MPSERLGLKKQIEEAFKGDFSKLELLWAPGSSITNARIISIIGPRFSQ